uniref:Putative secreted protein n=1 Tax=Anopheles darlingi TaxID=43151 RepID=A0A2M4DAG5_ANODA
MFIVAIRATVRCTSLGAVPKLGSAINTIDGVSLALQFGQNRIRSGYYVFPIENIQQPLIEDFRFVQLQSLVGTLERTIQLGLDVVDTVREAHAGNIHVVVHDRTQHSEATPIG